MATQLRRSDVGPAEIGAFVASFCLPSQLGLPTVVRLVQDSFGAMQDVAIDALAVITLHEDERGLANGHRRTAV